MANNLASNAEELRISPGLRRRTLPLDRQGTYQEVCQEVMMKDRYQQQLDLQ